MTQIRVGAIEALTVLQNVITEDFDVVEAVAVRNSVPELLRGAQCTWLVFGDLMLTSHDAVMSVPSGCWK